MQLTVGQDDVDFAGPTDWRIVVGVVALIAIGLVVYSIVSYLRNLRR